jgi:hypothetical protein
MVVTMASPPTPPSLKPDTTTIMPTTTTDMPPLQPTACCPSCGDTSLLPSVEQTQAELVQAHARIAELEAQVRMLNEKATAAVDRWADYEDELSKLRAAAQQRDETPPLPPPKTVELVKEQASSPPHLARSQSLLQSSTNRISQFLSRSMTAPIGTRAVQPTAAEQRPNTSGGGSGASATNEDLLEALNREQQLRKLAEGKLVTTSLEVEELSVTLFEQANEMVADERRARAKLEERVGELERRDKEKRRRLEKLEMAMARIERVRALLEE